VQFKNKYKDPVVITHISGNGPDPVLMRIKQLNSTSMTVFLQEPANEDAWHRQETGSYIVMETGVHTLPGGAVIEAGKYRARDAMWDTVTLSGVQNHGIPAYFSQVQTYNDPGFVVTRIKSLGSTSFQTQMIADEKRSASAVRHLPETMGWIALPFGQGTWPNFFEVGWKENVNHAFVTITLKTEVSGNRAFLASMNTYNGPNPSWTRANQVSGGKYEVKIDEENMWDGEQTHANEDIVYMAADIGSIEAVAMNSYDNDDEKYGPGWSQTLKSYTGDGIVHGPWGSEVSSVSKVFGPLPPHSLVKIQARFWFIDSWDGGEYGRMSIDGSMWWSEEKSCLNVFRGVFPNPFAGDRPEDKCFVDIDITQAHEQNRLELKFQANLGQDKSDESWAFSQVQVYIDGEALPPMRQVVQDINTMGGWVNASLLTSTYAGIVRGPFIGKTVATQSYRVPKHTLMRVQARFWGIGAWDLGSTGYLKVDGETWWQGSRLGSGGLITTGTIALGQSYLITSTFDTNEEFSIMFDIFPSAVNAEKTNVLHFTTGAADNQIPALYFDARTTRFNLRMSRRDDANDGCLMSDQLPMEAWSTVKIQLRGNVLSLYVDGSLKCISGNYRNKIESVYAAVNVYTSSPWFPAADASIKNLRYCPNHQCTVGWFDNTENFPDGLARRSNEGTSQYFDINVIRPHNTSNPVISFSSNLESSDISEQSFAFTDIRLSTDDKPLPEASAAPVVLNLVYNDVQDVAWSKPDLVETGYGTVHGLWGSSVPWVSRTFSLTKHSKIRVTARYWAIDSWDGEWGHMEIDGIEVWKMQRGGAVWSKYEGSFPNPYGGENKEDKAYADIDVTMDHSGGDVRISFRSTIDQGANDESWGFSNVKVYADSVELKPVFVDNSAAGWNLRRMVSTSDGMVHGVFGAGEVLQTSIALPSHKTLRVKARYWRIDSWDGEYAWMKIGTNEVWRRGPLRWNDGGNSDNGNVDKLRGNPWRGYTGSFPNPWNGDNAGEKMYTDIDITMAHDSKSTMISFGSSVDQSSNDEGFAINRIEVWADGTFLPVYLQHSDNPGVSIGWDNSKVVSTGDGMVHGPWGFDVSSVSKLFQMPSKHSQLRLTARFWMIDSWDGGEEGRVYIDGMLMWSSPRTCDTPGSSYFYNQFPNPWAGDRIWDKCYTDLIINTDHSSPLLRLRFEANLEQEVNDESWAFNHVKIYSDGEVPKPRTFLVETDVADKGWTDDSLEMSSEGLVHGTFAGTTVVSKRFSVGPHKYLRIKARFWAVDSWNKGEVGTLSVDGTVWWTSPPSVLGLLVDSATPFEKGKVLVSQFQTAADYTMSFDLWPESAKDDWRNVIHVTSNGDCCSDGERSPAVWFYGGTTKLHVRQSWMYSGNDGCDPPSPLPTRAWTNVKLEMKNNIFQVYYNGISVCINKGMWLRRQNRQQSVIYGSNPWYQPADGKIRKLQYCPNNECAPFWQEMGSESRLGLGGVILKEKRLVSAPIVSCTSSVVDGTDCMAAFDGVLDGDGWTSYGPKGDIKNRWGLFVLKSPSSLNTLVLLSGTGQMTSYGMGGCNTGGSGPTLMTLYAQNDGKGLLSQADCNNVCLLESRCRFATWNSNPNSKNCRRYEGNVCIPDGATDAFTFQKTVTSGDGMPKAFDVELTVAGATQYIEPSFVNLKNVTCQNAVCHINAANNITVEVIPQRNLTLKFDRVENVLSVKITVLTTNDQGGQDNIKLTELVVGDDVMVDALQQVDTEGMPAGTEQFINIDVMQEHSNENPVIAFSSNLNGSKSDESFAFSTVRLHTETMKMSVMYEDVKDPEWSVNSVQDSGDGPLHGTWDKNTPVVQRTFALAAHSKIRVTARYWAIDSWENEWGYLEVDGVEVWKLQRTSIIECANGWKSFAGAFGGVEGGAKCYADIDITISHIAETVTLRFKSNIAKSKSVESWAFSRLMVYADGLKMNVQFKDTDDQFDTWSDRRAQRTSDGMAHGPFGSGPTEVLEKVLPLREHSIMRITARYWAIDSWDGEFGMMKVGSDTWWKASKSYGQCGGTVYTNLFPNPWNGDNSNWEKCYFDIDVTKDHDTSTAVISFSSTIDQGINDESFFVNRVVVYTDGAQSNMHVEQQYLESLTSRSGWSDPTVTYTLPGMIHGPWDGYQVRWVSKTFALTEHTVVKFKARYWWIGTWDGGEKGQIWLDNILVFSQFGDGCKTRGGDTKTVSLGVTFGSFAGADARSKQCFYDVDVTLSHRNTKLTVKVESNLDQNDEMWAFSDVEISTDSADSGQTMVDVVNEGGASGWLPELSANAIVRSDSGTIHGLFDMNTAAAKTFTLPQHSYLNVKVRFWAIDNWQQGDFGIIKVDGVPVWKSSVISRGDPSNLWGSTPYTPSTGALLASNFATFPEFALSFEIYPTSTNNGNWRSIIHFSQGSNCCSQGDRSPAIWFTDGNVLRSRMGNFRNNDDGCDNTNHNVPVNRWSSYRMVLQGGALRVFVDGILICTQENGNYNYNWPSASDLMVYSGSPWHEPVQAQIRDVRYVPVNGNPQGWFNTDQNIPNPFNGDRKKDKRYFDVNVIIPHTKKTPEITFSAVSALITARPANSLSWGFNNMKLGIDSTPSMSLLYEDINDEKWSDNTLTDTPDGMVHGLWDKKTSKVQRSFSLPEHASIRITARFWALDAWNNEWGYMSVDGVEVWKGQRTELDKCNNGWSSFPGDFSSSAEKRVDMLPKQGYHLDYVSCYQDIDVTIPHYGSEMILAFKGFLAQDARTESWGFATVRIFSDGVPMTRYFKDAPGTANDWFNGRAARAIESTDDGVVHGLYGVGEVLERVVQLVRPHTMVRLKARFWAIDSWDGNERGIVRIDGTEVWTEQKRSAVACPSSSGAQEFSESFPNPWNGNNKGEKCFWDIDIVRPHTSPNCIISFTSTIDQAFMDESFAVNRIEVFADGIAPVMSIQIVDDPTMTSGWSEPSVMMTQAGLVHGPWGMDTIRSTKIFDLSPHTVVNIRARYWMWDSWDGGEKGEMFVDGILVWSLSRDTARMICSTASESGRCYYNIDTTLLHGTKTLVVTFTANLNEEKENEAWAFDLVQVSSDAKVSPRMFERNLQGIQKGWQLSISAATASTTLTQNAISTDSGVLNGPFGIEASSSSSSAQIPTIPEKDVMSPYGQGSCSETTAIAADGKGVGSKESCHKVCLSEPNCKFASFSSLRSSMCIRYSGATCTADNAADSFTFRKGKASQTQVTWSKISPTSNWQDQSDLCSGGALSLCTREQLCGPLGKLGVVSGGAKHGDVWIATADSPNSWMQAGNTVHPMCHLHTEIPNSLKKPDWGTGRGNYNFRGHLACCPLVVSQLFPPSSTTISVSKEVDVGRHKVLRIRARFWALDNWDKESTAVLKVDGVEWWSRNYLSAPSLLLAETPLKQSNLLTSTFMTSKEYTLSFDIKPFSVKSGWTNILHFTADNGNCCGMQNRIPAVWFHSELTRIHYRSGNRIDGNDGCDPEETLPLDQWTTVKAVLADGAFTVYFNGVPKCARRAGRQYENINNNIINFANVKVYASDPWSNPSDANIRNLQYCRYGSCGVGWSQFKGVIPTPMQKATNYGTASFIDIDVTMPHTIKRPKIEFSSALSKDKNTESFAFDGLQFFTDSTAKAKVGINLIHEDVQDAGWTNNKLVQTGDGIVHGTWGKELLSMAKRFQIPAHTKIRVTVRVWAVGGWSNKNMFLYIDDIQVWTKMRTSMATCTDGFTTFLGDFPNPSSGEADPKCFFDVDVTTSHSLESALIKFKTDLTRNGNEESWGFANLKIYADAVPYSVQYKDDSSLFRGWSNERRCNTDDGVVRGRFGAGVALQRTITPLKTHTMLRVKARYWAVDSWDGEKAFLKVDGNIWWSMIRTYYNDCAVDGAAEFSRTFPNPWNGESDVRHKCYWDIDIAQEHTAESAVVSFSSTLDSGIEDESFAVNRIQILTDGNIPVLNLEHNDDDVQGKGWNPPLLTLTGDGQVHGLWGSDQKVASKMFDLPSHQVVRITARFWMIDSWDGGEYGRMVLNGVEWWRQTRSCRAFPSDDVSGQVGYYYYGSFPNPYGGKRPDPDVCFFDIDVMQVHSDRRLNLRFESNLDEVRDNEAWGFSQVRVYADGYIQKPKIMFKQASDVITDGGWSTRATLSSEFSQLRGAFKQQQSASKNILVGVHKFLQVKARYWALDNWEETGNDGVLLVDGEEWWRGRPVSSLSLPLVGEELIIRRNQILVAGFVTSKEWSLTFDINPKSIVSGSVWANILHFTSDSDCCGASTRVPYIGYRPGTLSLHVAWNGNSENLFATSQHVLGQWTTVKIIFSERDVNMYNNNQLVASVPVKALQLGQSVVDVYASSPWEAAADAKIRNLVYAPYDSRSSWTTTTGQFPTPQGGIMQSRYIDIDVLRPHNNLEPNITFTSTMDDNDESFAFSQLRLYTESFTSNGGQGLLEAFGRDEDSGWSEDKIIDTSDGGVHGFWGSSVLTVWRTFVLAVHSKMRITVRFWALHTWEDEWAYLYVDNVEVWKKQRTNTAVCDNGWEKYVGTLTLDQSPTALHCYFDIDITILHTGVKALVSFKSTLNSPVTDEAWGFSKFTMSLDAPPMNTQFQDKPGITMGWSNNDVVQSDDGTTHGLFSGSNVGNLIENTFGPFKRHSQLRLKARFWMIDSWDGYESGYIKVDGAIWWSQLRTVSAVKTLDGDTCVPYNGNFPNPWNGDAKEHKCYWDVDVTKEHTSTTAIVTFTSSNDQGVQDEAFGFNRLELSTDGEKIKMVLEAEDRPITPAGWTNAKTTMTGDGLVHGPWGNDVLSVSKSFSLGPHTFVRVKARFWYLDSWDGGEWGRMMINGNEMWRRDRSCINDGSGSGTYSGLFPNPWAGDRKDDKCFIDIDVSMPNSAVKLDVTFESNIGQDVNDEAWAFNQLRIYSDSEDQIKTVLRVSDQSGLGTTGGAWSNGATSEVSDDYGPSRLHGPFTCGAGNAVSKVFPVVPVNHKALQIKVRLWAMGDWKYGDSLIIKVDGKELLRQRPITPAIINAEQSLLPGLIVGTQFTTSSEFSIMFDINPKSKKNGWGSIVHITNGDNCCSTYQRNPAIWFYPNSLQLHVRMNRYGDGNDGCDSAWQFPLNTWTKVKVSLLKGSFKVYYNDMLTPVCTNSNFGNGQMVAPSHGMVIYAGDPWYEASDSLIRSLQYCPNGVCSATWGAPLKVDGNDYNDNEKLFYDVDITTPHASPAPEITFTSDTVAESAGTEGTPAVMRVFARGSAGSLDMGATLVNTQFASSMFFFRDCTSCGSSHRFIFYKRLTPIPATFSIYDQMITTWSSANNVLNTDFKLYSSYADMMKGVNAWTSCNYDDSGIAFPRDCGPTGLIGSQWNSLSRGGQGIYEFYVGGASMPKSFGFGRLRIFSDELPSDPATSAALVGLFKEVDDPATYYISPATPAGSFPSYSTGWTENGAVSYRVQDTSDGKVHGPFTNQMVEKTYAPLKLHTLLRVKARYWAIDSWDNGEKGSLYVGRSLWWSQSYQFSWDGSSCKSAQGTSYSSSFPNPWSGDNLGHKCYWDIDLTKKHDESSVTLGFTSTVNQHEGDESFSFGRVEISTDGEASELPQQADEPGKRWTDNKWAVTGAGNVHGPWGNDVPRVQRTWYLGTHLLVRVKARFWAIDSWDNEWGYLKVDDVEWWKGQLQWNNDNCNLPFMNLPAGVNFPNPWNGEDKKGHRCYVDIDITRVHTNPTAIISFGSTIDQGQNDEAWAFSNVQVFADTPKLEDSIVFVNESPFTEKPSTLWSDNTILSIVGYGQVHGLFSKLGNTQEISRTINLVKHRFLRVRFQFWAIGKWENYVPYLKVNGVTWWSIERGTDTCGSNFLSTSLELPSPNNNIAKSQRCYVDVDVMNPDVAGGGDVSFTIGSTGRSSVSSQTASWGFSEFRLYFDESAASGSIAVATAAFLAASEANQIASIRAIETQDQADRANVLATKTAATLRAVSIDQNRTVSEQTLAKQRLDNAIQMNVTAHAALANAERILHESTVDFDIIKVPTLASKDSVFSDSKTMYDIAKNAKDVDASARQRTEESLKKVKGSESEALSLAQGANKNISRINNVFVNASKLLNASLETKLEIVNMKKKVDAYGVSSRSSEELSIGKMAYSSAILGDIATIADRKAQIASAKKLELVDAIARQVAATGSVARVETQEAKIDKPDREALVAKNTQAARNAESQAESDTKATVAAEKRFQMESETAVKANETAIEAESKFRAADKVKADQIIKSEQFDRVFAKKREEKASYIERYGLARDDVKLAEESLADAMRAKERAMKMKAASVSAKQDLAATAKALAASKAEALANTVATAQVAQAAAEAANATYLASSEALSASVRNLNDKIAISEAANLNDNAAKSALEAATLNLTRAHDNTIIRSSEYKVAKEVLKVESQKLSEAKSNATESIAALAEAQKKVDLLKEAVIVNVEKQAKAHAALLEAQAEQDAADKALQSQVTKHLTAVELETVAKANLEMSSKAYELAQTAVRQATESLAIHTATAAAAKAAMETASSVKDAATSARITASNNKIVADKELAISLTALAAALEAEKVANDNKNTALANVEKATEEDVRAQLMLDMATQKANLALKRMEDSGTRLQNETIWLARDKSIVENKTESVLKEQALLADSETKKDGALLHMKDSLARLAEAQAFFPGSDDAKI